MSNLRLRIAALVWLGVALVACLHSDAPRPQYGTTPGYCRNTGDGVLHVSPTGSDTAGDGEKCRPFRTLEKGRDFARAHPRSGGRIVEADCGEHWRTQTFTLGPADNGNTFRSASDDCAHLNGGQVLGPWEAVGGGIYRTPWTGADFYTLYEGGVRGNLARDPNRAPGASFPSSWAPYRLSEAVGSTDEHITLHYAAGHYVPGSWTLSRTSVFVWSGAVWMWFTDHDPISSVDVPHRTFTLENQTRYTVVQSASGSRYFVQGPLQLLDEAGEWTLDGGYVYYFPRATPIASQTIVAPTMKRIVEIVGTNASTRAANITFTGFGVRYSDFSRAYRHASVNDNDRGGGTYDRQATLAEHLHGAIYLENTDHVSVTRNHVSNTGYSGVFLYGYGQSDTVQDNEIEHVGKDGVHLEGPYPGTGDVLKNNTIINNRVEYVGELVGDSHGFVIANSSGNTLTKFEVNYAPRAGVFIYAYTGFSTSQTYAKNNVVSYGLVDHTCQDSGDIGAVYTFGLTNQANTFNQIIITNVQAHASMTDIAPTGVMTDNEGGAQTFSNIQVTNFQYVSARRDNSFVSSTETNCSWNGGFNAGGMDTANIGVDSTFPY